ncbi:winged helix-turn-helix domain-containing protein [Paraburkholderia sp. MM5482-R1]|uniref:winged helix-turn-helix domain-containing protein n=1 Tax=unclassified Paraburkholderia TaxID=2615204 RepID=UPI003D1EFD94
MKRPADTYIRFLELSEGSLGLPALDALEARILEFVARASLGKERLSVRDLMSRSEFGSPATVHARISSMRKKGFVMLSMTEDARRKQIELTPAALHHFDKLGEAFAIATREPDHCSVAGLTDNS